MLKLILYAAISALLHNCSSDSGLDVSGSEPLTDVLTLELSFGDKDLPDEYLLARPDGIAVNSVGDIYIADEKRIKVFDNRGKEKTIIGGPGEGPGEFLSVLTVTISSKDFLAVQGSTNIFHIFSPENEFISRMNFHIYRKYSNFASEKNVDIRFVQQMVVFDETTKVVRMSLGNIPRVRDQEVLMLVYETSDSINEIVKYEADPIITTIPISGNRIATVRTDFLKNFLWTAGADYRVVYTRTAFDRSSEGEPHFILHVMSCESGERSTISVPYNPVEITDDLLIPYFGEPDSDRGKSIRELEVIRNAKFFAPVQHLLSDGEFVFAVTYRQNNKGDYLTEIINLDSGEHTASVYFPDWINISVIKNRYAYRKTTNDEDFYIIEKYKIDPAVYGK